VEEFIRIGLNDETRRGSYLLTSELDMLGSSAMLAPRLNWAPIGMSTSDSAPADKFTGIFDGGGKKLWNLYIDRTSGAKYNIGLFGYVEGAKLRNIVLGSGSVQGYQNVGGIAGRAEGSSEISGCSNAAGVTATTNNAGGVAGYNNGAITNCSNTGSVTAITGSFDPTSTYSIRLASAGGVAGSNGGTITGCSNTGDVTATAESGAGGIAGVNYPGSAITSCSNTGNVTANTDFAGGIVGLNYKGNVSTIITKITACSNAGDVGADVNAGGITGLNDQYSDNIACRNTGDVSASTRRAGGIAGLNNNNATITACYNTGSVYSYYQSGGVAGLTSTYSATIACYTTGPVYGNSNVDGVVGARSVLDNIELCYWLDVPGDNAASGHGSKFAIDAWPAFGVDWVDYEWTGSGDEASGKYWKTVGSWDGVSPVFPKLYWEP
jgi:hypothetical protein